MGGRGWGLLDRGFVLGVEVVLGRVEGEKMGNGVLRGGGWGRENRFVGRGWSWVVWMVWMVFLLLCLLDVGRFLLLLEFGFCNFGYYNHLLDTFLSDLQSKVLISN